VKLCSGVNVDKGGRFATSKNKKTSFIRKSSWQKIIIRNVGKELLQTAEYDVLIWADMPS
jgi:hypothetical protein